MSACLLVCMCTVCLPGVQDLKRADILELKLQTVVNHHVDAVD